MNPTRIPLFSDIATKTETLTAAKRALHKVLSYLPIPTEIVTRFDGAMASNAEKCESVFAEIEKYLKAATKKDSVNADLFLKLMSGASIYEKVPWFIAVTDRKVVTATGTDVITLTTDLVGGIASTIILTRELKLREAEENFETAIMHTAGHILGLVPENRREYISENRRHCTSICVMRDATNTSDQWTPLTKDRLTYEPFCRYCRAHLEGLSNPKLFV